MNFTAMRLVAQVIIRLRWAVINQARYINPFAEKFEAIMVELTDEQTKPFLKGKPILSNANLVKLAAKIGVHDVMYSDAWADGVADYIDDHAADCKELWDHLHKMVEEKQ